MQARVIRPAIRTAVLLVVAVIGWSPSVTAIAGGTLVLASLSDEGAKGDGDSGWPSLSADGERVAFDSTSTNLDAADTDADADVFVRDLTTGDTTLASINAAGVKGDGYSFSPAISSDGTRVAFCSTSMTLAPADTDWVEDVYVKDLRTGDLFLASVSASGVKGDGDSCGVSLSSDGSKVVFQSNAANLDPLDDDWDTDIFVKDLTSGELVLVTEIGGETSNGFSSDPDLSGDGSMVAFDSTATNLHPADMTDDLDVYVKDLASGQMTLASCSDACEKGNASSYAPFISPDGKRVSFRSYASNLSPSDTDSIGDAFVKDLSTGEVILASSSEAGEKGNGESAGFEMSFDGSRVVFESVATNLDPLDNDDFQDIYVKDLATGELELVSITDAGEKLNEFAWAPTIAWDGMSVAFQTAANNLVPADTDAAFDIYVSRPLPPGPLCGGKAPTIVAPEGGGLVFGTSADDVILGSAAADRILARSGNDTVCGGAGRDELLGGDGRDLLHARDDAPFDILVGGSGADSCVHDQRDIAVSCEEP